MQAFKLRTYFSVCVQSSDVRIEEFVAHGSNVNCLSFGRKSVRLERFILKTIR